MSEGKALVSDDKCKHYTITNLRTSLNVYIYTTYY